MKGVLTHPYEQWYHYHVLIVHGEVDNIRMPTQRLGAGRVDQSENPIRPIRKHKRDVSYL